MGRGAAVGQPGAVQYRLHGLKRRRLAGEFGAKPVEDIASAQTGAWLSGCAVLRRNRSVIAKVWASASSSFLGLTDTINSNASHSLESCFLRVVAIAWRHIESARRIAGLPGGGGGSHIVGKPGFLNKIWLYRAREKNHPGNRRRASHLGGGHHIDGVDADNRRQPVDAPVQAALTGLSNPPHGGASGSPGWRWTPTNSPQPASSAPTVTQPA